MADGLHSQPSEGLTERASIEDTFKRGYFLAREPDEKILALVRLLKNSGRSVSFLSSVYTVGTAKAEKSEWLVRNGMGTVPCTFVPYGDDKSLYIKANERNVLLDDFSENLRRWEAAGHIGFKYYNGINGTHGTWGGYALTRNMSAAAMFKTLTSIAESN